MHLIETVVVCRVWSSFVSSLNSASAAASVSIVYVFIVTFFWRVQYTVTAYQIAFRNCCCLSSLELIRIQFQYAVAASVSIVYVFIVTFFWRVQYVTISKHNVVVWRMQQHLHIETIRMSSRLQTTRFKELWNLETLLFVESGAHSYPVSIVQVLLHPSPQFYSNGYFLSIIMETSALDY